MSERLVDKTRSSGGNHSVIRYHLREVGIESDTRQPSVERLNHRDDDDADKKKPVGNQTTFQLGGHLRADFLTRRAFPQQHPREYANNRRGEGTERNGDKITH